MPLGLGDADVLVVLDAFDDGVITGTDDPAASLDEPPQPATPTRPIIVRPATNTRDGTMHTLLRNS
ncbi:hypothetical protein [Rudaeicoccus suwonensis]|uniref:hypothetical protein n=1 Tax=Rudaeicoccus suwonensis TaxID=657409 RepID=UPI0011A231C2|nr:hypothetical protein [Rudaeicoccus suwonensis]